MPDTETHLPLVVWVIGDVPQELVDRLFGCLDALYRAEGGSGLEVVTHDRWILERKPIQKGD